jgi:hypothetical protein
MKGKNTIGLAVLSVCLAAGPSAAAYGPKEILAEVKALTQKMEMDEELSRELYRKVEATLDDPALPDAVRQARVNAVMVYKAVEAGFVVKFMKGNGFISFEGGRQSGPVSLRSWSAGAQVGGSAQWGAGLVLDIESEADFGGDYKGETKGATTGDTTSKGGILLADDKGHKIFFITTGRGMSAGIGGAKLTITPDW